MIAVGTRDKKVIGPPVTTARHGPVVQRFNVHTQEECPAISAFLSVMRDTPHAVLVLLSPSLCGVVPSHA